MNTEQPDDRGLDDLLKSAFADDLPDDAAAGMRARFGRFRAETLRTRPHAAASGWLFRKRVWAALSVLMLVSGGLLQGLASGSPLGDRILAVLDQEAGPDARRPAPLSGPAGAPGRGAAVSIREESFPLAGKEIRP